MGKINCPRKQAHEGRGCITSDLQSLIYLPCYLMVTVKHGREILSCKLYLSSRWVIQSLADKYLQWRSTLVSFLSVGKNNIISASFSIVWVQCRGNFFQILCGNQLSFLCFVNTVYFAHFHRFGKDNFLKTSLKLFFYFLVSFQRAFLAKTDFHLQLYSHFKSGHLDSLRKTKSVCFVE